MKRSAYYVENVAPLLITLTDIGDWEKLIRFVREKEELLCQNNGILLFLHLSTLTQS